MEKRIYKSNGRSIRRITEIAEVAGVEEGTIQLNKLFQWDSETDSFENLTIVSKTLAEIANLRGVSINALNKEWEMRKLILDFLVENNISKQDNLSKILEEYYLNPKVLLSKINP